MLTPPIAAQPVRLRWRQPTHQPSFLNAKSQSFFPIPSLHFSHSWPPNRSKRQTFAQLRRRPCLRRPRPPHAVFVYPPLVGYDSLPFSFILLSLFNSRSLYLHLLVPALSATAQNRR